MDKSIYDKIDININDADAFLNESDYQRIQKKGN